MQVIFIKDLKNQGKKGDIKEVKDGYAKNYLIKNGYAVQKTETSMNILNKQNDEAKKEDEINRKNALSLKKELEEETYKFKVKTGEHDKVFGSISTKQIKEKLDEKIKLNKNQIILDNSLSTLGYHNVDIILYKDIKATIKIELIK